MLGTQIDLGRVFEKLALIKTFDSTPSYREINSVLVLKIHRRNLVISTETKPFIHLTSSDCSTQDFFALKFLTLAKAV